MPGPIDFVNRAILELGGSPIAVLSPEDSPLAATAVELYPQVLDETLCEADHGWRFATSRVQLSKLTTSPANTTFQYEYALPADTIHVVSTDKKRASWKFYRDEASGYRRLYSNEEVVWADIVLPSDAALFPPHFRRAFVAKLKAALAMPVTRRIDMFQAFTVEGERIVAWAVTKDFNEEPWVPLDDDNLLPDARFG